MRYSHKWLRFIKERFNPLAYSAMIFAFLGAHYAVSSSFFKPEIVFSLEKAVYFLPLVIAVFLFFFKLRLFDEVKDMESDAVHHPERPLPRGLLRKNDILRAAFVIIVLEILLFSFYGPQALISMVIAIGYSLAMYKEFFIKKWLRAHLTTYAVTHTFVVVFVSGAIFSALLNESLINLPAKLLSFSIGGWFLFNVFEFGRKTFARCEEKDGVDSYSKIFGRFGAVFMTVVSLCIGLVLLNRALKSFFVFFVFGFTAFVLIHGIVFLLGNTPSSAKRYRQSTSLVIVFIYAAILFIS